jgi:hypothetical protein
MSVSNNFTIAWKDGVIVNGGRLQHVMASVRAETR